MRYEVKNKIALVNNQWQFEGQIITKKKMISVTGTVPNLKTSGMIKRAIIEKMKSALVEHKPKPTAPVIKVLSQDNIFKEILAVYVNPKISR